MIEGRIENLGGGGVAVMEKLEGNWKTVMVRVAKPL